ncbi:MAG: beta-galactosidase [Bifidobacterium psychraerophilum]|uniref:beta-galactosidase n=1 Tax=Bifidobacterium psychraerophilum TaxID=218140 RepID=UPI0039E8BDA2
MASLQGDMLGHDQSRQQGSRRRDFRWPALLTSTGGGIAYGGDYNPDQWSEDVWDDDIRLMRKAGVNTVAIAIFSWDRIQPEEQRWDFAWLDRIITKLGEAGIAVDLATATASAPLWLYEKHPEVLPLERNGDVVNPGSRQSWRPTSGIFKSYALEVCRRLARRYGHNPYVTAWHVNNEYGWNNRHDYSADALQSFRQWCRQRYGSVSALNEAWGTSFWSQEVQSFDEVLLPCHMGNDAMANPSQQLDFERFCSDALKAFYKAERDELERICPDKPFTTNFMVSTDQCAMDYADWSDEVDFVSNDHYFTPGESHVDELLCSDSLVGSLALGKPWYLMEHSTSAVQWKPLNSRKRSGELVRDALAHVAMGADAINFFQWRQSRFGAEAFHSSMLPHAGEDSKVFREVCELGGILGRLAESGVQGSELVRSRSAILFDADCEWATQCRTLPTTKLSHWHDVREWYRAFLDVSQRADVVSLRSDWSGYDTIVLPTMLVLSEHAVKRIAAFAEEGGRVVIGYATGLADENYHIAVGGYPGMLRDIAGVRSEEFNVLGELPGEPETIALSNGYVSRLWANEVTGIGEHAEVLATYSGGDAREWDLDGVPAIVRNRYGRGEVYYVGCDLGREDIAAFLREGMKLSADEDPGVVRMRRRSADSCFDFYLNRSRETVLLSEISGSPVAGKGAQRIQTPASYRLSRDGFLVMKSPC